MNDFESTGSTWAFVIDTDGYAGNYERQLTAFCTGHVGECEVGEEHVERFNVEESPDPFPGLCDEGWVDGTPEILRLPDDENGCHRPCAIHSNPRWFNDGVGHHYRVDDHPSEEEMLEIHLQHQLAYFAKSHPNDRERNLQRARDDHEEMRAAGGVRRWPAYMSVAIYFDAKPNVAQVAVIRRRAETFFAEGLHDPHGLGKAPVHIEGYRLIERVVTLVEHEVDRWEAKWDERMPQDEAAEVRRSATELGTCCHEKDCYWTVYRMDGDHFIGLCDGTDLWKVDESTARIYLSRK